MGNKNANKPKIDDKKVNKSWRRALFRNYKRFKILYIIIFLVSFITKQEYGFSFFFLLFFSLLFISFDTSW